MQADFCAELLCSLKAEGISTAVDTCGFVSRENLDKVIPYTDMFLYDIKAFDEDVHKRLTGVSNAVILENLRHLDSIGKSIEVRIPYVPECNSDQMEKIAELISGMNNVRKVRVLPYHNYASHKYAALGMINTLPAVIPRDCEISAAEKLFYKIT
jgi:pyruvate formate lyase activating enzyme